MVIANFVCRKNFVLPFVLVAVSISFANAQAVFDPAVNFDGGGGMPRFETVDVNNDGYLDIVGANKRRDEVSVKINQGIGTFAPKDGYKVGPFVTTRKNLPEAEPRSVTVADFDNDGSVDLAVSSTLADTISILLNNGDGTFGTHTDYTVRIDGLSPTPGGFVTPIEPEDIASVDLDKDGSMDLITVNIGNATASVLYGFGDGTFAAPIQIRVGGQPISLDIGDLDRDGWMDVVVANNSATVVTPVPGYEPRGIWTSDASVLMNVGGSLATQVRYPLVGANTLHLILADLNGDNNLDILTANHAVTGFCPAFVPCRGTSWASVLYGVGDGSFLDAIIVETDQFPNSVEAADLDGDGDLDICTSSHWTPGNVAVSWNLTDATGTTFAPFETLLTGALLNAPVDVKAFDVEQDGDIDLVALGKNSSNFGMLLNAAIPNVVLPAPPTPGAGGPPDLAVAISKVRSKEKGGETQLEIQYDVTNEGGAEAAGVMWAKVTVTAPDGATVELFSAYSTAGLAAGDTAGAKLKRTRPGSFGAGSTVDIDVFPARDQSFAVVETNLTNNHDAAVL